jgi:hypothetical protein
MQAVRVVCARDLAARVRRERVLLPSPPTARVGAARRRRGVEESRTPRPLAIRVPWSSARGHRRGVTRGRVWRRSW